MEKCQRNRISNKKTQKTKKKQKRETKSAVVSSASHSQTNKQSIEVTTAKKITKVDEKAMFNSWKNSAKNFQKKTANGNEFLKIFPVTDKDQMDNNFWLFMSSKLNSQPTNNDSKYHISQPCRPTGISVKEFISKCHELSDKRDGLIRISVLYVCVYKNLHSFISPVFSVENINEESNQNKFIDRFGRIYRNWDDYKSTNPWNGYYICIPRDGHYSHESASCYEFINQSEKWNYLSEAYSLIFIIALLAGVWVILCFILSASPQTLTEWQPGIWVTVGVKIAVALFVTVSNIMVLVDRTMHEQSVNLYDTKIQWIAILMGILITILNVITILMA